MTDVIRTSPEVVEQLIDTYKRMADEAHYRPAAPSDGFGNITVPIKELDLDEEALEYTKRWVEEESSDRFFTGCPNFGQRPEMVFAIEAVRCMCGMDHARAMRLLEMASASLKRQQRSGTLPPNTLGPPLG